MKKNALLGWCLAVALGAAACQDQKGEPSAPSEGTIAGLNQSVTKPDRNNLKLRSGRLSDRYLSDAIGHVINPDDYVCNPSTPVLDWLDAEIAKVPEATINTLFDDAADVVPFVEAILFETSATPQYFGYTGEYTQRLLKTDKGVKSFWDIFSADIHLVGAHGPILLNKELVTATYEQGFQIAPGVPVPHFLAVLLAQEVHDLVEDTPELNGGNHPFFSFNANAFSAPGSGLPDKIIMGDGLLEGYKAVGFGDVAPEAVYAHEFGHHIQFENGYFDDEVPGATTVAELTMYSELMADAFAGYYLTHKRGAALNRKRVEQFFQVFFQLGDCAFANPGHHGTPNQRMKAAEFGFDLADEAQKQGHILTSEEFHTRFVEAYPDLIAPDAT